MKKTALKKGFTLMETMIYIALFGIIMTGALVGTYNLLEGGDRNINSSRIEEEGTFLNRKLSWAVTGATAAAVSGGGNTITIIRPDLGGQSPLTITGGSDKITIARGSGPAIDLNNERFKVTDILFTYTAPVNGRPAAIAATFKVEGKQFTFRNYLRQ